MTQEALKLALEALKKCHYYMIDAGLPNQSLLNEVFTAYKALETLAQQEQEPCKTCGGTGEVETGIGMMVCDDCHGITYTTPPQRTEQEPVAYLCEPDKNGLYGLPLTEKTCTKCFPVYRHPQRPRVVFPTMLRKMWSGSEVQSWLDENVNKENT